MEVNKKLRYGVAILFFITILVFFLPYIQYAVPDWGWEIGNKSFSLKDILAASESARLIVTELGEESDLPFLTYLPYLLGIIMIMPFVAAIVLIVGKHKSHFWLGIAAGAVLFVSHFIALSFRLKYSVPFDLAGVSLGFGFYTNISLGAIALIGSIVGLARSAEPSMSQARQSKKQGLLIGRSGMYANETIDIPAGEEIILGRDSALAHIVLDRNSEKVSRKHCGIFYDDVNKNYAVIDYSTNGTFVEGGNRLVANIATILPSGTVILLGNKENSFTLK
ncbi:MAG TPA: hypothetical protein DG577_07425 [Firmicutes bacterium]|jgi:hypothetical protein|nr:hypothetical protein [Bacillota bacterium]